MFKIQLTKNKLKIHKHTYIFNQGKLKVFFKANMIRFAHNILHRLSCIKAELAKKKLAKVETIIHTNWRSRTQSKGI